VPEAVQRGELRPLRSPSDSTEEVAQCPRSWRNLFDCTEESFPELKGTRAWIVVPRCGWDSIENVPFSSFSRSSMLRRPIPRLVFAASMSKLLFLRLFVVDILELFVVSN
jgi:hypothetical protein